MNFKVIAWLIPVFLFMLSASATINLSENLAFYYGYDSGYYNASKVNDLSPNNNDGTLDVLSTGVTGVYGEGITVDGSPNDDRVTLDKSFSIGVGDNFSCSWWFKNPTISGTHVFGMNSSQNYIYLKNTNDLGGRFRSSTSSQGSYTIPNNKWTNLILSVNGTSATYYENGTFKGKFSITGGGIFLNTLFADITWDSYDWTGGTLDESGCWDGYALTEADALQVSTSGVGGGPCTPLNLTCWEGAGGAAPPTSSLDIIFRNLSNVDKTNFDEDEHFRVFLNHSLSNGTHLDSECNITLDEGVWEIADPDEEFTLCTAGCDYSIREYTANYTGVSLTGDIGINDTMHFEVCHPQNPLGDLTYGFKCAAGEHNYTLDNAEIPLCSAGTRKVFHENTTCINSNSVEYLATGSGTLPNRLNITFFSFDRVYDDLKVRAENFSENLNNNYSSFEYYRHGTKTINASCYYDASYSNTASETITVVNTPPVILHSGILNSKGLFNLTNGSLVNYAGSGNWSFLLSIEDDDLIQSNHTLYCGNGTILWLDEHNEEEEAHGIYASNFTDFDCNPFVITTRALDSGGNYSQLSSNFNVTDTIFPYFQGLVNTSVIEDTTYSTSIVVVDENVFRWNYTCSDGTSNSATGLNEANSTIAFSLSVAATDITCQWEACDGHTSYKLARDWDVRFRGDNTILFRIDNQYENKLMFDATDINLSYKRYRDRVSFTLEDTSTVKERDYTLYYTVSDASYYFKDDKYKAWIVDDLSRTWFDLNGLDSEVNVFYVGNGTWELTFHTKKDKITFHSIGELNCMGTSQVIMSVPEFNMFGQFDFGRACPDNSIAEVGFLFFVLIGMAMLIMINLFILRLFVLDFVIGVFFVFFGLSLMGCAILFGTISIIFGLMYAMVLAFNY